MTGTIRTFQAQLVPGLPQTPECIRAVPVASHQWQTADEIEQFVQVRLARQERLVSDAPLRLWAVLSEAVLLQQPPRGGGARRGAGGQPHRLDAAGAGGRSRPLSGVVRCRPYRCALPRGIPHGHSTQGQGAQDMNTARHGTPDLSGAKWRSSTCSGGNNECLELARDVPALAPVRDSKNPDGPVLPSAVTPGASSSRSGAVSVPGRPGRRSPSSPPAGGP
ncbi:Scr1 family TA system antitoxin-like transcriptional regulator [Streptomyces sp. NPDC018972]|uniref:DUF397 domain-containing protein n=1 Tax=Streptomyces sp. NPDC018972 TaxID=3365060 RepID=UPI00378BE379